MQLWEWEVCFGGNDFFAEIFRNDCNVDYWDIWLLPAVSCEKEYFVCVEIGLSLLMQNMIPAAVATLYAEIIARVVKAPATVFLIPGVIPLTPGGKLYYTMRAIIDGNESEVDGLGNETVVIALGIAVGIVLVSLVFYQISHRYVRFQIRFGETMK